MIDPHTAAPNEDPEDHIGAIIPDPWDDPEQTDWSPAPWSIEPAPDVMFKGWF